MSNIIENEARAQWEKTFTEISQSYDKEKVVESIASIEIPNLDPDPIMYGPGRIQHKISSIVDAFKQLDAIFMNLSQRHREAKRFLLAEKHGYQTALRFLLTQDPKVRSGKTGPEREILAQNLLSDKVLEVSKLEALVSDFEILLDLLKMKKADIKEVQSNLRTQMRLIDQQLSLNMKWGNKAEPPKEFNMKPNPISYPDKSIPEITESLDFESLLNDINTSGNIPDSLEIPSSPTPVIQSNPLGLKPKTVSLEQSMTDLEVQNIFESFDVKIPEKKQNEDSFTEALSFLI